MLLSKISVCCLQLLAQLGARSSELEELETVAGTLQFTVLEGRNLKNMDAFSKQDPYVKLSLVDETGTVMSTGQTAVIKRGGTDPKVRA